MAASPSPNQQPHAGVSLDPRVLHTHADHDHAEVEPIPWKGEVGVVRPLDVDTSWTAHAPEPPTPVKKSGCGDACGCKAPSAEPSSIEAEPRKDPATMKRAASTRIAELASILGIGTPREAAATAYRGDAAPKAAAKPKKKLPGSGIPARPGIRFLVWVRRASQVGFFALFMFFLFQTGFRGTFAANSDTPVRLPYQWRRSSSPTRSCRR
ncbi:MAG: hypothetical protein U0270_33025 [Labilithrix sp.]